MQKYTLPVVSYGFETWLLILRDKIGWDFSQIGYWGRN